VLVAAAIGALAFAHSAAAEPFLRCRRDAYLATGFLNSAGSAEHVIHIDRNLQALGSGPEAFRGGSIPLCVTRHEGYFYAAFANACNEKGRYRIHRSTDIMGIGNGEVVYDSRSSAVTFLTSLGPGMGIACGFLNSAGTAEHVIHIDRNLQVLGSGPEAYRGGSLPLWVTSHDGYFYAAFANACNEKGRYRIHRSIDVMGIGNGEVVYDSRSSAVIFMTSLGPGNGVATGFLNSAGSAEHVIHIDRNLQALGSGPEAFRGGSIPLCVTRHEGYFYAAFANACNEKGRYRIHRSTDIMGIGNGKVVYDSRSSAITFIGSVTKTTCGSIDDSVLLHHALVGVLTAGPDCTGAQLNAAFSCTLAVGSCGSLATPLGSTFGLVACGASGLDCLRDIHDAAMECGGRESCADRECIGSSCDNDSCASGGCDSSGGCDRGGSSSSGGVCR
jgi:hypothetical protein